jgi:glycosyltransferase involved in cell wall biosynthesis
LRKQYDVVLVVPDDTPEAGGNWVTAQRLAAGLGRHGLTTGVFHLRHAPAAAGIFHAFNAVQVGLPLLQAGRPPERMVVTWTGTDVLSAQLESAGVRRRLADIPWHTVLTAAMAHTLAERFRSEELRWVHIPPGVDGTEFGPDGPRVDLPHPAALLVGAVRPVKGTQRAVHLAEMVRRAGHDLHLVIVGPPRDREYWSTLVPLLAARPWIQTAGSVGRAAMPAWYRAADVVINTSDSEGLSNALLEALAAARPVVARDVPGNRAVLAPGEIGWLFSDAAEFVRHVSGILTDPVAAEARGRRARAWILTHFSPEAEVQQFLQVYRQVYRSPEAGAWADCGGGCL